MTIQFIIYNLTVLVIIAHFLDSALSYCSLGWHGGGRRSYTDAPNRQV